MRVIVNGTERVNMKKIILIYSFFISTFLICSDRFSSFSPAKKYCCENDDTISKKAFSFKEDQKRQLLVWKKATEESSYLLKRGLQAVGLGIVITPHLLLKATFLDMWLPYQEPVTTTEKVEEKKLMVIGSGLTMYGIVTVLSAARPFIRYWTHEYASID